MRPQQTDQITLCHDEKLSPWIYNSSTTNERVCRIHTAVQADQTDATRINEVADREDPISHAGTSEADRTNPPSHQARDSPTNNAAISQTNRTETSVVVPARAGQVARTSHRADHPDPGSHSILLLSSGMA